MYLGDKQEKSIIVWQRDVYISVFQETEQAFAFAAGK